MTYHAYYTLLSRERYSDRWAIEFGAYDRADVKAERDEYRDKGYRATNLMIITSDHTQAEINRRVAELNHGKA